MKTHCLNCAQSGMSCCKGIQICLTTGDVLRISRFLRSYHFFTIEMADFDATDPANDSHWLALTIRPDGQRRVLKRTGDKSCVMLNHDGCLLPMSVRPLLCRLHPYMFTEAGISGVDPTCPISRERDWPLVLQQLGMEMGEACKWHEALYCELFGDKHSGFLKDAGRYHPKLQRY